MGVPISRASLSMEIEVGDGMTRPSVYRVAGRDTWAGASWGDRGPHEDFNCAERGVCQAPGGYSWTKDSKPPKIIRFPSNGTVFMSTSIRLSAITFAMTSSRRARDS